MKRFSGKHGIPDRCNGHCLSGGILASIALILWLSAAPAWAAPPVRPPALVNTEEGQAQPLTKARLTIQKKSLHYIYAHGQRFAVNKETVIVGTDGKEVALKKMLVPCDVEVMSRIENGVRTAMRIDIRRVAADAGWQWGSEQPE